MSASKIDHKELKRRLKEDELAHFFWGMRDNLNRIFQSNGRQVTLAIGLVVVIAMAFYFWRVKSNSDFLTSQQYYSNAVAFIQKDQYPEALNELNALLKDYSGSKVAMMARVLRGDCFAKNGDYEMALSDYKAALSKLPAVDSLVVRFAVIQTLRSLERTGEALAELDALEKQVQSSITKEQITYLRGCCFEDKSEIDKALEAFKSIPPKSNWYFLAVEKIAWLEAKPAEAINAK